MKACPSIIHVSVFIYLSYVITYNHFYFLKLLPVLFVHTMFVSCLF